MKKLFAEMRKEFLVLIRDIPGLTILFLMPMFLILVVTLTQENAFKKVNESKITILWNDNDTSLYGETIEKGLVESGFFEVIKVINNKKISDSEVHEKISKGEFQIGVIIPANAAEISKKRAEDLIKSSEKKNGIAKINDNSEIKILVDPTVRDSYKNSVVSSIKRLIQAAEFKILIDRFIQVMNLEVNNQFDKKMKSFGEKDFSVDLKGFAYKDEVNKQIAKKMKAFSDEKVVIKIPEFPWNDKNLIKIKEEIAQKAESVIKPSIVQNNVPAFTLFAMFFIVIPLSGSLISERNEGVYNRLRTLPVSYFTLVFGKVVVYTFVCIIQFVLMLCVGLFILPIFFGFPALELGSNYFALILATVASALAAIGFGLLVGTFSKTHNQGAMFGSVMVVILGIMGGIFLPIYLMPESFRHISMLSPVRWGIDSFLNIFVRAADVKVVLPDILRLVGFFILALFVSMITFLKRN
ncbi:MAG: ABC transporter permease [Bacteroidetes bacterium]|nr:ABC transporter permease [Bacteroidota bacterium]